MSDEIVSADAGASLTFPIRGGEVKKGLHVMIKGKPCKVIEVTTSKTGKHGHAKANITGIDIFTGKKYEEICPTSHNLTAPVVTSNEWTLLDINEDGYASLMNGEGEMREDLQIPADDEEYAKLMEMYEKAVADGNDFVVSVLAAGVAKDGKAPELVEKINPSIFKTETN
jgi:translation initiation factor 5A